MARLSLKRIMGPDQPSIRTQVFRSYAYLPWQQSPHLSGQQDLLQLSPQHEPQAAFAAFTSAGCAKAVTARTSASESTVIMRFMDCLLLTLKLRITKQAAKSFRPWGCILCIARREQSKYETPAAECIGEDLPRRSLRREESRSQWLGPAPDKHQPKAGEYHPSSVLLCPRTVQPPAAIHCGSTLAGTLSRRHGDASDTSCPSGPLPSPSRECKPHAKEP